jgi:hypothetical protein
MVCIDCSRSVRGKSAASGAPCPDSIRRNASPEINVTGVRFSLAV